MTQENKKSISLNRLKELISYDPESGIFSRKSSNGGVEIGSNPNSENGKGYIKFSVGGKKYYAHRLAWFYVHGEWPKSDIDHIDGNTRNNRIKNLRDAPEIINMQNIRKAPKTNKTGILGVHICGKKFRSSITANGEKIYLGVFQTIEEAHTAYIKAKRNLHEGCTI